MAKKNEAKKKRLDVFELRDELVKVAEKEAKKKPDISKQELKHKLSGYITDSEFAEHALTPGMKQIVERLIGVAAEVAVKMVEIYFREKQESEKHKEAPVKPAPAKKATPKKKAAKKK